MCSNKYSSVKKVRHYSGSAFNYVFYPACAIVIITGRDCLILHPVDKNCQAGMCDDIIKKQV